MEGDDCVLHNSKNNNRKNTTKIEIDHFCVLYYLYGIIYYYYYDYPIRGMACVFAIPNLPSQRRHD